MGIIDNIEKEKNEIDKIVHFYKCNTSQNKFLILKRYIRELINRLNIFLFKASKIRKTPITKKIYNKTWKKKDITKWFKPDENVILHFYKNKYLMASAGLSQRIWQYLIIEKIKETKPKKVLEVASGNGANLKILAEYFDNIDFTGIDFSEAGINESIKNQNKKCEMIKPLDLKYEKRTYPLNNLNYYLQDATNLNFDNEEFDLVFTCLGLEQMNDVKLQAIKEIKRCSKSNIVLIEPFKDLNMSGIRYLHHKSSGYFDLKYNELSDGNFKIIDYKHNYPCKIFLKVGLLHLSKS